VRALFGLVQITWSPEKQALKLKAAPKFGGVIT
jgi:hypothetical protein